MDNSVDLVCQEIFNKSTTNFDVKLDLSKEHSKSGDARLVTTEEDFSQEMLKDLTSNRRQREGFTSQIIAIMCVEIAFIALLIMGVFLVSCLNSLAPKITFNFPPVFLTLSLCGLYAYLYKFCGGLPPVRISYKKLKFKKHQFSLNHWSRVIITIVFLAILNILARQTHTITFTPIVLTDNIINMILSAAIAVFVKTTILAGYIIKGLYQALNKPKHDKKTPNS